ncbi:unnamed protein product [Vitrella brassicaformis CCMP3155]|uniref:Uncharacterized protein n=1 Tax=Vitrella brassicaformis (strain CCMP3155) TaxID=1169540 RepID=A0A0G4FPD6_VITBC|nr:unnamed protein product [Vitrella brassicaformis CCMP3155]|eukprot:CEM16218.1 unnamed protein product [Vitrella brassicaformis CCMP3155]
MMSTLERRPAVDKISRRDYADSTTAIAAASLLGLAAGPSTAAADIDLMSAKRSYFRYVPRIEKGRDMYVLDLRPAIESENWQAVQSFFEVRKNDNTYASYYLTRPMEIWSTSFSEKGTGDRTKQLQSIAKEFEDALDKINVASGGKSTASSGGLFAGLFGGGGGKSEDKRPPKTRATEAWSEGKAAFNKYIALANEGISAELKPLEAIPDDLGKYKRAEARPETTF